jgi:CheY-like chemotaxis protein
MSRRLKTILVVDDSRADQTLTRLLLEDMDCADHIQIAAHGAEALDYLTTRQDGEYPCPELICLDINMPVMDGWEFAAAYEKLPDEQTGEVLLMMLTSLDNAQALAAEKGLTAPAEFSVKPLTEKRMQAILARYFPD